LRHFFEHVLKYDTIPNMSNAFGQKTTYNTSDLLYPAVVRYINERMSTLPKEKADRIIYYQSYTDDVVKSANQDYSIPNDYKWIRSEPSYRIKSTLLYAFARIISPIYCRCFLHMRLVNRKVLDKCKNTGLCLFANHTQPIGDAMLPVWINRGRRIYVIVSPANLGIPGVGKLLPYLGALPASGKIKDMLSLNRAVFQRLSEKHCLVVYPEAHVWPYYTRIRPFSSASFIYPVTANVPAYCMTTTYQKSRFGKKPCATVYIDGPFYPSVNGSRKEQADDLRIQIAECMERRSKQSTCEYIRYIQGEKQ